MQVGIDVGATKIESVVLEENGNETHRSRTECPKDYFTIIKTIKDIYFKLENGIELTLGDPNYDLKNFKLSEIDNLYIEKNGLNKFFIFTSGTTGEPKKTEVNLDHLLENIKFHKKENSLIFDQILECIKSGNLDGLQVDNQLLDQIEKYANIKHIVHKNDKDESKIVEIFNDLRNELKTHDLELRIQELESKFAEDFNQNTFDEINRLKKEQNIN